MARPDGRILHRVVFDGISRSRADGLQCAQAFDRLVQRDGKHLPDAVFSERRAARADDNVERIRIRHRRIDQRLGRRFHFLRAQIGKFFGHVDDRRVVRNIRRDDAAIVGDGALQRTVFARIRQCGKRRFQRCVLQGARHGNQKPTFGINECQTAKRDALPRRDAQRFVLGIDGGLCLRLGDRRAEGQHRRGLSVDRIVNQFDLRQIEQRRRHRLHGKCLAFLIRADEAVQVDLRDPARNVDARRRALWQRWHHAEHRRVRPVGRRVVQKIERRLRHVVAPGKLPCDGCKIARGRAVINVQAFRSLLRHRRDLFLFLRRLRPFSAAGGKSDDDKRQSDGQRDAERKVFFHRFSPF